MGNSFDLRCDGCGYALSEQDFTLFSVKPKELSGICPRCDRALLSVHYSHPKKDFDHWKKQLKQREGSLWRYHELLPLKDSTTAVSFGEGWTPLIHLPKFGNAIALERLYIKDERQGPTASFKDRQATVAISFLKEQGVKEIVLASTGNVAIAYSAYAARAQMQVYAFFPEGVAKAKITEAALYGAKVVSVGGTYDQAKAAAKKFATEKGLFLDQGVKTFAGVESMKTMGFEIAEQLNWRSPDWYIQGVSGGMGPIGVAKGFMELKTLGLVDKIPALGLIQSSGCAPITESLQRGDKTMSPVEFPDTAIATLATGNPSMAYPLLKKHLDLYGGAAATATDEEAFSMVEKLASTEGILVEPATAVTFVGVTKLASQGIISPQQTVVINCSGREKDIQERDRPPLVPP